MKLECNFFAGSARILNDETVMDVIKDKAREPGQEDPFYILDVGDIVQKIKIWKLKMPRVKPFYAVKCNDNPTVLDILATLGVGFDCASKSEIQKILQLGVESSRIIYAHPCKPASHLRHAAKLNVPLMTFDNETELQKIKAIYPDAKLVLRIRCDATDAQCPLGMKFGAMPEDASALLSVAQALDLNIVGVSFHVGSGCREPAVFHRAIAAAKKVFEEAEDFGYHLSLLDIGGGFPGTSNTTLDELAETINDALEEFFPESSGVEVIAEPGRYVVASAFTLATNIVAKREVVDDSKRLVSAMYYINDGIYGSFSCTIFDHQEVHPVLLKEPCKEQLVSSSVWGPTCDGLDQVKLECQLPRLCCGDWLVWPNMGAYTLVCAGSFNGFPSPKVHVVVSHHTWLYLEEELGKKSLKFGGESGGGSAVMGECGDQSQAHNCPQTCAASSGLDEHLSQLTFIDVAEM